MIKRSLYATAFVLGLLGADQVWAQGCSSLHVTGTIDPGHTVTVAVTHSTPHAATFLAASEHAGTTVLHFGPAVSLTLGLDSPLVIVPLGTTDGNGNLTQTFSIPNVPPALLPSVLFLQAITVDFSSPHPGSPHPTVHFCMSNVASVHAGS